MWCHTPIIPALGIMRQEHHEFEFEISLRSEFKVYLNPITREAEAGGSLCV